MSFIPGLIWDFNHNMYFVWDSNHNRVYQNDARFASQTVPRSVAEPPRTGAQQTLSPYYTGSTTGSYAATPQQPATLSLGNNWSAAPARIGTTASTGLQVGLQSLDISDTHPSFQPPQPSQLVAGSSTLLRKRKFALPSKDSILTLSRFHKKAARILHRGQNAFSWALKHFHLAYLIRSSWFSGAKVLSLTKQASCLDRHGVGTTTMNGFIVK